MLSVSRLYSVDDSMFNESGAVRGKKIGDDNQSTLRKPSQLPLHTPQMPHDLTCDRARAAVVGSRWITAWSMARPTTYFDPCRSASSINSIWIDLLVLKKNPALRCYKLVGICKNNMFDDMVIITDEPLLPGVWDVMRRSTTSRHTYIDECVWAFCCPVNVTNMAAIPDLG
jgi:hypothetical protein